MTIEPLTPSYQNTSFSEYKVTSLLLSANYKDKLIITQDRKCCGRQGCKSAKDLRENLLYYLQTTFILRMATKWGIVSAGKISHDFVVALSTLSQEEHKVVAVAARDLERAQAFADLHKIPSVYGSYEELAKDPNVDVVYIGAVHPQHLPIGKMMLNNGKPILCEKPLTMNLKETTELISLAREKGLFLMEAIWSRCFPAYDMLRREMEAGNLGEIVQVIVNFGFPIESVDRMRLKELGGGTILDLGVYCLQLAVLVFGPVNPTHIVALGHLNEFGCDESMACVLKYEGGKTAVLSTNARVLLPNEAYIIGTKGSIKIPNFWCPTSLATPEKTCDFILPTASKSFNFVNSAGLRYEAMEVRRCLREGLLESPKITHAESKLIAELEDKLRKEIGVTYEQDE
ncbi:trans-1,2-dihydrobenzene-1,2-diol dehydrogenase-like [Schistocerca piceifrons]|uniref:trans-1,2-dihydrobenzene-1,2-diol dehydrogenase-like n=1 Tax=Schistocerca piceifrons TaxID=274613 RepID=UPI001F5F2DED|nr:trans-1,2-dihydrobenzene-1,2-diol dehydrogenase-like [Schistocerca piceifrons]XP_049961341.1 trans-1,2-dihydrobenzene-1,2-diol dehydrogenase-like [Schistocerca serialis cubense]